ncbi:MAG TPA: histidine phosphatase family protein [Polyangiales bacterium]|nr:histidine phosphatase family protein [Polyangiales bacterium]
MAVRTLLLIRHGQYHLEQEHDRYGQLTPLGQRQTKRLARRLAQYPIDVLHSSTAPRALETVELIGRHLPEVPRRRTPLLLEGLPGVLKGMTKEQRGRVPLHRARMDRAFARYFRPTRGRDRFEVLICHGNIIRYLLRKALGDSIDKWSRSETTHCGMSIVLIEADGSTRISAVNDVGHLPRKMQTFQ